MNDLAAFWASMPTQPAPNSVDAFAADRTIDQEMTAKRWAKRNGYYGAQGGWVYRSHDHKPVCQGWSAFAHKFRRMIVADLAIGYLTPSRKRG